MDGCPKDPSVQIQLGGTTFTTSQLGRCEKKQDDTETIKAKVRGMPLRGLKLFDWSCSGFVNWSVGAL